MWEGHVKICLNNTFITVCDGLWDEKKLKLSVDNLATLDQVSIMHHSIFFRHNDLNSGRMVVLIFHRCCSKEHKFPLRRFINTHLPEGSVM